MAITMFNVGIPRDKESRKILKSIAAQKGITMGELLWKSFVSQHRDSIDALRNANFFVDSETKKSQVELLHSKEAQSDAK